MRGIPLSSKEEIPQSNSAMLVQGYKYFNWRSFIGKSIQFVVHPLRKLPIYSNQYFSTLQLIN